jgi:hypothetical protein
MSYHQCNVLACIAALCAVLFASCALRLSTPLPAAQVECALLRHIRLSVLYLADALIERLIAPEQALFQMLFGSLNQALLYHLVEHNIVDIVQQAGVTGASCQYVIEHVQQSSSSLQSTKDLLASTATPMCRMLEAAASIGILHRIEQRYTLSRIGSLLLAHNDALSLRSWALLHGRTELFLQPWRALGKHIPHAIDGTRTDDADFYRKLHDNRHLFDEAMAEFTRLQFASIVQHAQLDTWFQSCSAICDVGGGQGTLLLLLLQRMARSNDVQHSAQQQQQQQQHDHDGTVVAATPPRMLLVDMDPEALQQAQHQANSLHWTARQFGTLQWNMFDDPARGNTSGTHPSSNIESTESEQSQANTTQQQQQQQQQQLATCDCVILKGITSDLTDQQLAQTLHNLHRVSAHNSSLLVLDHFLDRQAHDLHTLRFIRAMDLLMLSLFGAASRQRYMHELLDIAQGAGWSTVALASTLQSPLSAVIVGK